MSATDSRCFQPIFLEKAKTHVHLTDSHYKSPVMEKCIFASKENRRISLLTTRATKREEGCNLVQKKNRNQKDWIHFVGVGGCGISALALLAVKHGFEVSGSDLKWSSFMDGLQQAGVRLHVGHSTLNIESENGSNFPNAIVVSSAIGQDNVEILLAKSLGIPVYKRDSWLAKLTENHKLIAVAGTHGKSSTASLLAYVLKAMGDDLTALVGAYVPQFPGGNTIWGDGPHFVLEADEYDGCFLELSPYIAVVTNVEWEHVDFFQDECHRGEPLAEISLQIPGAHNVLNSIAVIATVMVLLQGQRQVHELINSLKSHLPDFIGLSRRFEAIGKIHGRLAAFRDDFAAALSYADHVVITEVYSVREAGPWNVCGKDLTTFIVGSTSEYIPALDDVVEKLALEICKDPFRETIILTLGAGTFSYNSSFALQCFFFLFNTKRSCGDSFFPLFTLLISTEGDVSCLDWNTIIDFFDRDGPTKSYRSALLCSPVVSVWDCIVRKMRYSYIPEWV
ncbi:hypothetical protein V6N13_070340 [Hibiscus sabdariffa]